MTQARERWSIVTADPISPALTVGFQAVVDLVRTGEAEGTKFQCTGAPKTLVYNSRTARRTSFSLRAVTLMMASCKTPSVPW